MVAHYKPFSLLHHKAMAIDLLHLEKSGGGYEYILVVMDRFTRYTKAYATKNDSARTVAQKIFSLRFSFPLKIHNDQKGRVWKSSPGAIKVLRSGSL